MLKNQYKQTDRGRQITNKTYINSVCPNSSESALSSFIKLVKHDSAVILPLNNNGRFKSDNSLKDDILYHKIN